MTTRYRTTETTTWREVDGEVVALEMKESVYYSIGGSGNVLWRMLADGATRDELVAAMASEYPDVDEPTAQADVEEFLTSGLEQGLIETVE
jgi:hypothetical protein